MILRFLTRYVGLEFLLVDKRLDIVGWTGKELLHLGENQGNYLYPIEARPIPLLFRLTPTQLVVWGLADLLRESLRPIPCCLQDVIQRHRSKVPNRHKPDARQPK